MSVPPSTSPSFLYVIDISIIIQKDFKLTFFLITLDSNVCKLHSPLFAQPTMSAHYVPIKCTSHYVRMHGCVRIFHYSL